MHKRLQCIWISHNGYCFFLDDNSLYSVLCTNIIIWKNEIEVCCLYSNLQFDDSVFPVLAHRVVSYKNNNNHFENNISIHTKGAILFFSYHFTCIFPLISTSEKRIYSATHTGYINPKKELITLFHIICEKK